MKPQPKFKKGQTVYKVGALGVLDWVKIHDLRQVANSFVYGDIAGEWWHEHQLFCTDIELIENELRYWNELYDGMKECEHVCHDFFVCDGDVVCSLCGEIYKKVNK